MHLPTMSAFLFKYKHILRHDWNYRHTHKPVKWQIKSWFMRYTLTTKLWLQSKSLSPLRCPLYLLLLPYATSDLQMDSSTLLRLFGVQCQITRYLLTEILRWTPNSLQKEQKAIWRTLVTWGSKRRPKGDHDGLKLLLLSCDLVASDRRMASEKFPSKRIYYTFTNLPPLKVELYRLS